MIYMLLRFIVRGTQWVCMIPNARGTEFFFGTIFFVLSINIRTVCVLCIPISWSLYLRPQQEWYLNPHFVVVTSVLLRVLLLVRIIRSYCSSCSLLYVLTHVYTRECRKQLKTKLVVNEHNHLAFFFYFFL